MRQTRGGSIVDGMRRGSGTLLARCLFAIGLTHALAFFLTVPPRLGPAVSFALACLCAALVLLVLLSLIDHEVRLGSVAARLRELAASAMPTMGARSGSISVIEASAEEMADRVTAIEQRLLHRHPVSGLPTREPLFAAIAASQSGVLGVIHLLDLERLQAFDEALAEHVLAALAERVVRMLGTGALVAQVDRARLAVWFGAEAPAQVARTKLQALGYALGEAVSFGQREVLPEIRVSHAQMREHGTAPAMLLARASVSPSGGADVSAPAIDDPLIAAQQLYALEQDLRRAVARGELELAYQPLVDAQAGAVCGAEALLRWRHPEHGLVPPTRFVPIMEAAGLADEIGLWAINAACREAATWRRLGLGPLRVAVNISGHQLDRRDLVTLIERTLARHSLSSDLFEIELTETIAAGDVDRIAALFGRLRRLGVAIAIDDFGTGYSSFSTLRTLRFDKLKIDREFVTAVDRRRDSQAICRAILALGQGLGIRVLAEGVETAAEYSWLNGQGCRHFQGYYFARPLDPAAFRAFVQDERHLAGLLAPISVSVSERLRA